MVLPRTSPFINEPYGVAVAGTASLVEDWLKTPKLPMDPDSAIEPEQDARDVEEVPVAAGESTLDEVPKSASAQPKRWYHGCIGGVPIPTLLKRLWIASSRGLRSNRYRVPVWVYLAVFIMLWVAAVGNFVIAVWEVYEVAYDVAKDGCGEFPAKQAYRILSRGAVGGLPILVTMTIFMFPALYKA